LPVGGLQGEVSHDNDQQQKLNAKLNKLTNDYADGADQPWKIHFAENTGIGDKCIACIGEACGKVAPDDDTAHLKQHRIYPIGVNASYYIKEQNTHGCGEYRLNKVPKRPQYGLFVFRSEISFYKKNHKVPITPKVGEVGAGAAVGLYDGCFHFEWELGFSWLQFAVSSLQVSVGMQ